MSKNRRWFPSECDLHINVREILAAYFAVQRSESQVQSKHVKLMADNTTALTVMNHMDQVTKTVLSLLLLYELLIR